MSGFRLPRRCCNAGWMGMTTKSERSSCVRSLDRSSAAIAFPPFTTVGKTKKFCGRKLTSCGGVLQRNKCSSFLLPSIFAGRTIQHALEDPVELRITAETRFQRRIQHGDALPCAINRQEFFDALTIAEIHQSNSCLLFK